jgi:nucleotide-binding universal stress UspA family protein
LPGELERAAEEMAESRPQELLRKIREAGAQIAGTHARVGSPDAVIVGLAGGLGDGLIVTGSRGRGPLRRAFRGSVSDSGVRHASCPHPRSTPRALTHAAEVRDYNCARRKRVMR